MHVRSDDSIGGKSISFPADSALFPGLGELASALRLVPATVLAVPPADVAVLRRVPDSVTTVLLVGAPTAAERAAAAAAVPGAVVLAVHAASAHRSA